MTTIITTDNSNLFNKLLRGIWWIIMRHVCNVMQPKNYLLDWVQFIIHNWLQSNNFQSNLFSLIIFTFHDLIFKRCLRFFNATPILKISTLQTITNFKSNYITSVRSSLNITQLETPPFAENKKLFQHVGAQGERSLSIQHKHWKPSPTIVLFNKYAKFIHLLQVANS